MHRFYSDMCDLKEYTYYSLRAEIQPLLHTHCITLEICRTFRQNGLHAYTYSMNPVYPVYKTVEDDERYKGQENSTE